MNFKEWEKINEVTYTSGRSYLLLSHKIVQDSDWSTPRYTSTYIFQTDSGTEYTIDNQVLIIDKDELRMDSVASSQLNQYTIGLLCSFGTNKKYKSGYYVDYNAITNEGKIFRILSTVFDAIKKDTPAILRKSYFNASALKEYGELDFNLIGFSPIADETKRSDQTLENRRYKLYKDYIENFTTIRGKCNDQENNLFFVVDPIK
jgi:hypothetical protein